MTKGKYIIKIILMSVLFCVFISGATWKQVSAETEETKSDVMDLSGITRDDSGNYIAKKKYVTREEFAQMLVQASAYAREAEDSGKTKLFRDVSQNSTKAAYIQIAVSKGYMSGYLGGKFQPKKAVIMKEAVYGTLGLLGYTEADFTGNLSGTRYDKFKELGLGKNLTCDEADKLTKADCETLFYNLLNAKQKTGDTYAKVLGYPLSEDGTIDYQGMLEKNSKGPYLTKSNWEKSLTRELSSYDIIRNNKKISSEKIKDYSIAYFSDQSNKLWIYDTKVYGCLESITYSSNKPQEFTVSGTTYTVEKPEDMKKLMKASNIQKGMIVVLLLGRDDKVSNVLPVQSAQAGSSWKQLLNFDISQAAIYKNGTRISSEEVESTDIIYYSKEIKTVWVYGKKVYGVVDSISPSASAPEKIVVAGITYDLTLNPVNSSSQTSEGSEDITKNVWGTRLSENGIHEGDDVVVLFGYNNKVADICTVDKMPVTLYGYVLAVENKVVKDANKEAGVKQVIRIVDTEGTIREFQCSDNTITKYSVVEVSFQSGNTLITKLSTFSNGNIVSSSTKEFAEDVRAIEINDLNYTKISATQLKDLKWDAGNAIYCKANASGEITDIILQYVTDSFYQYGLLKKVTAPNYEEGIYGFQLTFDIANTETTMLIADPKGNINPGPKAIQIEDNKLKDMKDLQQVKISYINGKQANAGDAVYRIADDVLVYYYKNGEYYKGDFDEITNNSNSTIEGYVENIQRPIRIIVVTK